jgi:hypothetical protein
LTFALILCAGPSLALDPKLAASLKELDPTTRLIQVCDLESMDRIDRDSSKLHPDRVMVDALGPPRINEDTVSGDGAALRSRGKWFHFSFKCSATADHLKVKSFTYKLGAEIPRAQWEKLGLFD